MEIWGDLPCVQQASSLEVGPLMWMLQHVNKKSDCDYDIWLSVYLAIIVFIYYFGTFHTIFVSFISDCFNISMIYPIEIYTKFRIGNSVAGFAIFRQFCCRICHRFWWFRCGICHLFWGPYFSDGCFCFVFFNFPDRYFLKYIHEVLLCAHNIYVYMEK